MSKKGQKVSLDKFLDTPSSWADADTQELPVSPPAKAQVYRKNRDEEDYAPPGKAAPKKPDEFPPLGTSKEDLPPPKPTARPEPVRLPTRDRSPPRSSYRDDLPRRDDFPRRDDLPRRDEQRDSFDRRDERPSYSRRDDREYDRRPRYSSDEKPAELPTAPPFKVFVANLSYRVDDMDLGTFFVEAGCATKAANVQRDRETDRPRGFGHVEFEDLDSLKRALDLSGRQFQGREIRIELERRKPSPQQWRSSGPPREFPFRGDRDRDRDRDRDGPRSPQPFVRRDAPAPASSTESLEPKVTIVRKERRSNPFGDAKPVDTPIPDMPVTSATSAPAPAPAKTEGPATTESSTTSPAPAAPAPERERDRDRDYPPRRDDRDRDYPPRRDDRDRPYRGGYSRGGYSSSYGGGRYSDRRYDDRDRYDRRDRDFGRYGDRDRYERRDYRDRDFDRRDPRDFRERDRAPERDPRDRDSERRDPRDRDYDRPRDSRDDRDAPRDRREESRTTEAPAPPAPAQRPSDKGAASFTSKNQFEGLPEPDEEADQ